MSLHNELSSLHERLTNTLNKKMEVREVTRVITIKGEDVAVQETVEPTAAEMAVAVALLKHNNITAPVEEGSALAALRDKMKHAREKRAPVLPDVHAQLPGMH